MRSRGLSLFALCLLLVATARVDGLELGESCRARNNVAGVCELIYNCRQALTDLKAGLGKILCKTGEIADIVCCPRPGAVPANVPPPRMDPVTPAAQDTSNLRLSERKCLEYTEFHYENITIPVLIPGGQPIVRRTDKCAIKVIPLIVGGIKASPKEFPHMARLGYGPDLSDIDWSCGGSLISRRYVLTAAHCVITRDKGEPTYVRLGVLNFTAAETDSDSQTIRVQRVIVHPNYKSNQQYNDVALLELAPGIRFNQYTRPACLNSELNANRPRVLASGWGHTEYFGDSSESLQKVTLDVFQFHECQPSYASEPKLRQGLIESQHMCAGSYDSNKDTCEGDSGGPLQVYHLQCMYKILGVTSFGKGCGNAGLPGVYARVSHFIDWIESIAFRYG